MVSAFYEHILLTDRIVSVLEKTNGDILVSPTRLERKAALHLVGDHFADGERGGGGGRRSVADVQHAAAQVARAAVEHKVVHQVAVAVQRLRSHAGRTPAPQTQIRTETPQNETIARPFFALYLSTSLRDNSGIYFCRILTCAPMKMPRYISPMPYEMFFNTSF